MKPSSIDILGFPYKVIWCKTAQEVDVEGRRLLDGSVDQWSNTIRIHDNERPAEEKFQTLWHEVIHALIKMFHLEDLDEKTIDLLATGITYVMLHNEFDVKTWDISHPKPGSVVLVKDINDPIPSEIEYYGHTYKRDITRKE
jgi:hypothetical protein